MLKTEYAGWKFERFSNAGDVEISTEVSVTGLVSIMLPHLTFTRIFTELCPFAPDNEALTRVIIGIWIGDGGFLTSDLVDRIVTRTAERESVEVVQRLKLNIDDEIRRLSRVKEELNKIASAK